MAIQVDIIRQIRRLVNDWHDGVAVDQTYDDNAYVDAINYALSRIANDIGTYYSLIELPQMYDWAVVLLGAIYIGGMRVTESHNSLSANPAATGQVKETETEGLRVEFFEEVTIDSDGWRALIKKWWDEYKLFVDNIPRNELVAVKTLLTKKPLRGWSLKRREADKGISTSGFALSGEIYGSENNLKLIWTPCYDTQFYAYRVEKKLASELVEEFKCVTTIYDNHVYEYIEPVSSLSVGTWHYRVVLFNKNTIKTFYPTIELEIV